jgi:hypothetical protein
VFSRSNQKPEASSQPPTSDNNYNNYNNDNNDNNDNNENQFPQQPAEQTSIYFVTEETEKQKPVISLD